jgi:S-DNA-T family DNA segregation ATPase FtsK/SpoIIIE
MDQRYKQLAEQGTRNIIEFNRKAAKKKQERMSFIVIIIDELADLMMLSPEETERGITRLAQLARATGIHMVIATQRPSVDVVTGLIKANFPARIAFAVASSTDSRVILDTTGAERLLGQGDMLFQSPDAASPLRMQGCFVSEGELGKIIEYWHGARRFSQVPTASPVEMAPSTESVIQGGDPPVVGTAAKAKARKPKPTSAKEKTAIPATEEQPATDLTEEETIPLTPQPPLWDEMKKIEEDAIKYSDDLLPEAIALVRQLGKASTSLLQRRFRIGYTRAARMMDVMEEDGVIGPPTGTSKAREVLPWDEGEEEQNGQSQA